MLVALSARPRRRAPSQRSRHLPAVAAVAGLALLTLAMATIGCGGSGDSDPAAAPRALVIYSTHGRENVEPVLERFRAAHPDLAVQWRQFSTVDLHNAIRVEADDPQADVWWGGPHTTFMQAEREGLLAPYRPTWADAVEPAARSAADMWYGNFRMPECIMFNADVLEPDEAPQEWDDLLDPRWRGRIVLRDPSKSGTMRAIFGAMIWRTYATTGDDAAGFDWLRRLHDNVAVYAPDPRAMYQALHTPETPVTVWNMVDAHIQSREGYDFGVVLPASGVPVLVEGIAIVRGARHRAAAEAFYEWVTSEEQLVHQAERFHRIPARRDIAPGRLPAWMTEREIVAMEIDAARYAPLEGPWMERFRREIQTRR